MLHVVSLHSLSVCQSLNEPIWFRDSSKRYSKKCTVLNIVRVFLSDAVEVKEATGISMSQSQMLHFKASSCAFCKIDVQ